MPDRPLRIPEFRMSRTERWDLVVRVLPWFSLALLVTILTITTIRSQFSISDRTTLHAENERSKRDREQINRRLDDMEARIGRLEATP